MYREREREAKNIQNPKTRKSQSAENRAFLRENRNGFLGFR